MWCKAIKGFALQVSWQTPLKHIMPHAACYTRAPHSQTRFLQGPGSQEVTQQARSLLHMIVKHQRPMFSAASTPM
eukprot:4013331-Alexandrium_andersonii.AAC.1